MSSSNFALMYRLLYLRRPVRAALLLFAPLLVFVVKAQTNPFAFMQGQQQQTQQDPGLDLSSPSACPEGTTSLECNSTLSGRPQPMQDPYSRPRGAYVPDMPNYGSTTEDTRRQMPSYKVTEPPTEFQRFVEASTGHLLPIYGASLFDRVPSTFAPANQLAASPDYPVGPGDEIDLRVWGQVNFSQRFRVNPTGDIFLPQVGRVNVTGLKFGQLQETVKTALGRVYRNFDLNVNMGQLRSMQIFILGQARRPGTYTLSSLSTMVNALFASGGPSPRGSLRNISLKRGNKLVTTLDFYDLLLRGDKANDVQLMSGDVIFIPAAGPRVAVEGSVESPAIFELKDNTSLGDLLGYAGGLSPVAAGQRAILERVDAHASLHSEDVALSQQGLATRPQGGDILRVLSLVPQFARTVTLRGNVSDPIRFPWHSGMKVSDLIPNKDVLLTRGYWRIHNQLLTPEEQAAVRNEERLSLRRMDPSLASEDARKVPDTRERPDGDQTSGTATQKSVTPLTTYREETHTAANDSSLASATDTGQDLTIRQFLRKNDVQPIAPNIDWSYASIERLDPRDLTTHIVPFNLGKAVLEHDPTADVALEPGDIITILSEADISVPRAQQTKYVRIEGEVKMAGVYSVNPGETLQDVLIRAGGLTPSAYLYGAQLTRESTRKEQQKRYTDFLDQLESDINHSAATLSGRIVSADQGVTAQSTIANERALVARLRQTAATGRIVLDLKPNSTGAGALPKLPLENGDRFLVPHVPSTVNVVGMVYNQAAFLYGSDRHLGDYLQDAGGPSRYADRRRAFVIRADGSVISRDSRSRLFSGNFDGMRMYPGDTLVMPTNVSKTTVLRNLIDWSQVISSFGIGVAAINVLK